MVELKQKSIRFLILDFILIIRFTLGAVRERITSSPLNATCSPFCIEKFEILCYNNFEKV